jgi:ArsR family transcriptional regulator, repressor of sdpIR and other operons
MDNSFTASMPNAAHRHMERVFMALSDETRRSILLLLEKKEHAVGEIVNNFHLSQPTISRHLSVLREANLVNDERRGQRVIYSLNGDILARSMQHFFGNFEQCRGVFQQMSELDGVPPEVAQAAESWGRNNGYRPALRPVAVAPASR